MTFTHNDTYPGGLVHDVDIHHDSMSGHIVSRSLQLGDTYTVEFEQKGDVLLVDGQSKKTVDFTSGSVNLHVHCNLHPEMSMRNGITVNE